MTLYVHKKTIKYFDYGSYLGTETGIAWSTDNENPQGFEHGRTIEDARARAAHFGDDVEILEGTPIERSHDMNPRGDI